METIEELYGKELSRLLSKGLDWIVGYSRHTQAVKIGDKYNPTQAVLAAALHALATEDIEAFMKIHRVANLSHFQYPKMKAWLMYHYEFPKRVLVSCLVTLGWLVVVECLTPNSPLVEAVTSLEIEYNLRGVYLEALASSAKQRFKQTLFNYLIKINSHNGDGSLKKDLKTIATSGKNELLNAVTRRPPKTFDTLTKLWRRSSVCYKPYLHYTYIASKINNMRMIRSVLLLGQLRNQPGETAPLHLAATSNKRMMVMLMLFAGADMTKVNPSGLLPLHLTTDPEILSLLLEKGADVNAKTPEGNTALHSAVLSGNKEAVEVLMRFGAKPKAANGAGHSPLHIVLKTGKKELEDLLRRVAVIEKFCHVGEPFQKVAAKGQLETVREVPGEEEPDEQVCYEADSVYGTADSSEALQSSSSGTPQLELDIRFFPEQREGDGPIHTASCKGHIDAVLELLCNGVPIDIAGDKGHTALQYAAKYGHLNIVQMLVEMGADINLGNEWNWTPLHHAAHYCRYDITWYLLEAGANPYVVDNIYGKTPLSWATYNQRIIDIFHYKGIYS